MLRESVVVGVGALKTLMHEYFHGEVQLERRPFVASICRFVVTLRPCGWLSFELEPGDGTLDPHSGLGLFGARPGGRSWASKHGTR